MALPCAAKRLFSLLITTLLVAAVLTLRATAAQAAAPVLHPELTGTISVSPGSPAVVTNGSTLTMQMAMAVPFCVNPWDGAGAQPCVDDNGTSNLVPSVVWEKVADGTHQPPTGHETLQLLWTSPCFFYSTTCAFTIDDMVPGVAKSPTNYVLAVGVPIRQNGLRWSYGMYSNTFTYALGTVPPPPPPPPTTVVADFTSTAGSSPGEFTFTATSTDPSGEPLSHSWNFGDGTTGAGGFVSHRFTTPGEHNVTLTSTDLSNRSGTVTKTLTVTAPKLGLAIALLNGAAPPLTPGTPVSARVTVSASADGVGALNDVRFSNPLLQVSPANAFLITSGPTPAVPPAGFTLDPGQDRTFEVTIEPQIVGRYTLSSQVTGTDGTSTVQTADATSPGVIGDALSVTITLDPPTSAQPEGPDGPQPVDVTATITFENTTSDAMDAVTLTSLRVDRTQPGQLLAVTQTGGADPGTTGLAIGALAAGQKKSVTATFRATDDAEVEFSAMATGHFPDGRTEIGSGKQPWSVKPKYLVGITSTVTNPAGTALLPAGELIRITGRVTNLTTSASVELGPLYPVLTGNAGVMSLSWDTVGTDPRALIPQTGITLGPGESRNFSIRILTTYSDPTRIGTDGNRTGGIFAIATFTPYGTATFADGTTEDVTPDKVRATAADLSHRVSIDDSVTIPTTDPLTLVGAFSIGAVEGVFNATAATVMATIGLVKLPYTVVAATAEFQAQVWGSFTASERQDFANDTGLMVAAVLARNAELAKQGAAALFQQAKDSTLATMTEMENDWVLGDYAQTARLYTRYSTDAIAQILLPIALAKMAKSPRALAALARAQKAVQTRMAPLLARSATLTRIQELGPVLSKLASGTELTAEEIKTLYGISPAELSELQRIADDNHFLLTVRSRHASSIDWIERFKAMLKPETLKIKTVSELDARLGYRASDVGSLVFRKPEALARFEAGQGDFGALVNDFVRSKGFSEGTADWETAIRRVVDRSGEWRKWEKYYKRWDSQGWIDVSMNYDGNFITDPVRKGRSSLGVAPLDSGKYQGFQMRKIGTDEYVLEMMNAKYGRFVPITGDIDPIAWTHLDGSPLTMAEHANLLDLLAKNPLLQAQHGESASFKAGGISFVLGQFKPGEPALQIAPGHALPRVVRLNPGKSRWSAADDYHLHWDGGYVYSGSYVPQGARPLPAASVPAAVEPLPMQPRAIPQAVTHAPNVGRCHVTFSSVEPAAPAIMDVRGKLVTLSGNGKTVQDSPLQAACFSAGTAIDVTVRPVTGLSADADVGASELQIPTGDPWLATAGNGLRVGDLVTIGAGTPNAETHPIIAFGSIIVAGGLQHDHPAGELIIVTTAASATGQPEAGAAAATTEGKPGGIAATGVPAGPALMAGWIFLGVGAALMLCARRRGPRRL